MFSLFYTYCLIHCNMHSWTHCCFLCVCTLYLMQCYMHRWTHWRFPCFCTYCLKHCYMHRWTQLCLPFFVHSVLCIITCSVDQACVFLVLYILFYPVLHATLDTLVFSVFCTHCLMQCYIHRWTHWCFPCFLCTYCLMLCSTDRSTH